MHGISSSADFLRYIFEDRGGLQAIQLKEPDATKQPGIIKRVMSATKSPRVHPQGRLENSPNNSSFLNGHSVSFLPTVGQQ